MVLVVIHRLSIPLSVLFLNPQIPWVALTPPAPPLSTGLRLKKLSVSNPAQWLRLMTNRWLSENCLKTVWQLPKYCQTTFCCLLDDCLKIREVFQKINVDFAANHEQDWTTTTITGLSYKKLKWKYNKYVVATLVLIFVSLGNEVILRNVIKRTELVIPAITVSFCQAKIIMKLLWDMTHPVHLIILTNSVLLAFYTFIVYL